MKTERKKITDAMIRSLIQKTDDPRIILDSLSPLRIKVSKSGVASYFVWARWGRAENPASRTIGRVNAVKLPEARETARVWALLAQAGDDPQRIAREREEEAAASRALTFGSVWEEYVTLQLSKKRRGEKARYEVERAVLEAWREKPLKEITKRDVVKALDLITAKGHHYHASNVYTGIRSFFSWAIKRGVYGLGVSPFDRLSKPAIVGPTPHRERNLSDDEVRAFWRATGRLGYPFGPLFRLLLLTGARLTEIAEASWREFHPELIRVIRQANKDDVPIDWSAVPDEVKVLTIPRERFKSNSTHLIALSDAACEIVAALPHFRGPYVFTTMGGERPVSGFSVAKRRLESRMLRSLRALARGRGQNWRAAKLERFTLHDLRHVLRSRLAAMRVPYEVAEMIVGHAKVGLQRVYDQHSYQPEMREALQAWADKLERIARPPRPADNVLRLPSRRSAAN